MKNWSESKEERKLRKADEKALRDLADSNQQTDPFNSLVKDKYYILCLILNSLQIQDG